MKVEKAVFHVYGDHGRAVVCFTSWANSEWTVAVKIGKLTVDIDNTNKRTKRNTEHRPCPTHALAIVKHLLARPVKQAKPRLKVAK